MIQNYTKVSFDTFESWIKKFGPKRYSLPPFQYTLSVIYLGKLLNLFWFSGDVPEDLDQEFIYHMNINGLSSRLLLSDSVCLGGLSLGAMIYLCGRMSEPDWLDNAENFRGKLRRSEFLKRWPAETQD